MDQHSVIGIIELSSIIIAGGLGIAGAITDTKDKKGRLTKWGIFAVAGIIISNSFSFIQSYLQQQSEDREQLELYEKERIRDSTERVKYYEQMQLLYTNINKSDSSLKQQLKIQSQTSSVLGQMNKSLVVQNDILEQSSVLKDQQEQAAEKIDQTLNPLFPTKMDIALYIEHGKGTTELNFLTSLLNLKLNSYTPKQLVDSGLDVISVTNKTVLLGPKEREFYLSQLRRQSITISFSKTTNNSKDAIHFDISSTYLSKHFNPENVEIIYLGKDNSYRIQLDDLLLNPTGEEGRSLKSTTDLEGAQMEFNITGAPGIIRASSMTFKFPPDFSKIRDLKQNGKHHNSINASSQCVYRFVTDAATFLFRKR